MDNPSRDDIRRLLKTFGIAADEAILTHLARNPGRGPLRIRLTLEDLPDTPNASPAGRLHFEIEGEIRAGG
jgi:hypothetical protein